MTENKKKATKKEVAETSETPLNVVKKAKTKEKSEKQDVITETLTSEEVDTVTAEDLPEVEKVTETAKAEDYGFDTEEKKEQETKKSKNRTGR